MTRYDGTAIQIKNPQIVNGVQTSTEIYNYFKLVGIEKPEARTILVRILNPKGAASQDRIIKATNSQNAVAAATLRSTEKIHRDIEQFFRSSGLFYDRRRKFYKNEGRLFAKIIGIPYLAQALMAIALRRPNDARARPSSLLKSDDQYRKVFSEQHPIRLYLICALIMRKVDEFVYLHKSIDRKDATNLRYYVAMLASIELTKHPQPKASQVAQMDVDSLSDGVIEKLLNEVNTVYKQMGAKDQIAKGPDLVKTLVSARVKSFTKAKKVAPVSSTKQASLSGM